MPEGRRYRDRCRGNGTLQFALGHETQKGLLLEYRDVAAAGNRDVDELSGTLFAENCSSFWRRRLAWERTIPSIAGS